MKPSDIESTNVKTRVGENNFIQSNLFFFSFISLIILGMICLNGCSEDDSLNLSTDSLEFQCSDENKTFSIESNIAWTVDCGEAAWLTVSPPSGSDNAIITVTTEENTSISPREAIITVSGGGFTKTVNIVQGGFVASFSVSTTSLTFTSSAEQKSFNVTSNIGWSIYQGASTTGWLTISPTSGTKDGTITVNTTANTSVNARKATITFYADKISQNVELTQSGGDASLAVSSSSLKFSSSFSLSQTFTVTSNTNWNISKGDATWFTVSPTSGSSFRTITVNASANTSASPRTGTITITADGKTETISVTQEEYIPVLTVSSEPSFSFLSYSSEMRVTVTSNTRWTVSSSASSWLTVSPSDGSNNGAFTIKASGNALKSPREATITVSGGGITRTIKVTQSGAEPYVGVSKNYLYFSNTANTSTISVYSNTDWTIKSSASWLTVSPLSGSNDEVITINATANLTTSHREATITVSGGGDISTINVSQWEAVDKGSIVFWISNNFACGYVNVTLSGHGTKTITGFYYSGAPSCGDEHTATFTDLPIGTYTYTASCGSRTWSGTVTRTESCHGVRLSSN